MTFARFTERARHVLTLARDEALTLKHSYVGTEHILLGLLREEHGVAARVLRSIDIDAADIRPLVQRIVGEGDSTSPGVIPFTPRSKKVLEKATREALTLGHNYVGTEHLLLALMAEGEGVAARILTDLEKKPDAIRALVLAELRGQNTTVERDMQATETTSGDHVAAAVRAAITANTQQLRDLEEERDKMLKSLEATEKWIVNYQQALNQLHEFIAERG